MSLDQIQNIFKTRRVFRSFVSALLIFLMGPLGAPVSFANAESWKTEFSKKLRFQQLDFSTFDVFATKLKEKISEAEADYLYLRLTEAEEKIREAINSLLSAPPYSGLEKDLKKALALSLMISNASEKTLTRSQREVLLALPFAKDVDFVSQLSRKVRLDLDQLEKSDLTVNRSSLPADDLQFYSFGKELNFPTRWSEGLHFIHALHSDAKIRCLLVSVDTKNQNEVVEVKEIASIDVWNFIEAEEIQSILPASAPQTTGYIALDGDKKRFNLQNKKETKKSAPSKTVEKPSPAAAQKSDPLRSKIDPLQMEKNQSFKEDWTDLDQLAGEDESVQEWELLRSPWFWVGVGLLVGGSGYLIYDQTRTKTVRTP